MLQKNVQVLKAFSWNITELKFASKTIDKSVIRYRETVIPVEIRDFFEIENYTFGDRVDIILFYKGKEYESAIFFENHNNRSKLKINSKLHEVILESLYKYFSEDEIIIEDIRLIFIREERNKYTIKIAKEI
ncbi:hypothetical protein [Clostridium culturomicium]|uniref:hypothetical protein n=1 Tax=Clostridium culturomicium TaxID=1499683 RepID=UPI0038577440